MSGADGAVREAALAARIAREGRWRDVPYADAGGGGRIDPRTLSIALDDLLPAERTVCTDSGNFGAEVHHFGPGGHRLDTVVFPPADFAAIARGYGWQALSVREPAGLAPVAAWLAGPRERPLLVHARVAGERGSWWLEEAFRGH
ncbi:hypothetical protein GCM10010466_54800 [Planomonospora alba]|uniref:Uncharacterized protein n=1 Tax=Planomonospora alba TaxID=161354 RepID=A0ABP6NRZ9_9ACTN